MTMASYKAMKNGRTCNHCIHYDGEICTRDLNNLDYSYETEGMYRAPFDTCEDFEDFEEYEEEE